MRRFRSRKPADAANTWKTIVETVLYPTVLAYLLAEWVVRSDPTQTESPCLSNPCVYGICLDDVNSTFHCYCIDGYTGFLCQTNWDECWSNPCMNGGLCIDGIAHYNCTCPQGYQGDFCEQNIDECISNPCRNNGTCIDGSNGYTCVCPSGYVGVLCETDVSVCNDTRETRCLNGGLCTEGPGLSFNCVCPLGWTGQLCEESVDECSSSPCQNGAVCLDLHANYMCACPFGFTGKNCEAELEMCGDSSPCQNGALCLVEDWLRICYCVPDFHGDRCQYRYNECLLGPGCKNGGTCIDGVDGYNCTCPPGWSGSYCECLIKSDDHMECDPFFPSQVTALTLLPESHQTVPKFWTENQVPKTTPYKIPSSTPLIPQYPTECFPVWPHYTTQAPKTSTQVVVTKKLPADEQKTSSLPPQEITSSTRLTTSTISTKSTTMSTTTFSTIKTTISTPTTTTLASNTTMTSTTATSTTSTTTTTPITTTTSTTLPSTTTTTTPITTTTSTNLPPTTTTTTTSVPTTTTASTTSSTTQTTTPSTTQVPPTTTTGTTTSSLTTTPEAIEKTTMTNSTTPMTTTTESIIPIQTDTYLNISLTVNTETTMNETRTSPQPTTEDFIHTINLNPPTTPSSTAMPGNCKTVPCFNEGSCVNTTSGVRCICKSHWEGPFCEQKVDLKVVGFSKNSYVRHRLTNTNNIKIGVTARTIAPVGIILYSHLGNRIFMTLYLENGYLKFKFSCGLQVMILSEVQYLLNNGYDFIISVSLDFLPLTTVPDHCAATVRVNNTIAMSGEQVSGGPHADSGFAWVYVGGVPIQYSDPQEIPIPEGFIGCMQNLTIDHQTKGIFKDSFDSVEVSSCKSLACLSNPCRGGSSCIEHNNTWTCLCPSGFLGRRCEKSVCENNPCLYGGTCVPFPGSGFICLCPFGKQGLFCENSIETGYPLFASSINGLSSFAAYKIPSEIYQDLQLTFKFVPHDMEQISLMLFMGQDGYHGATSDHLAVSFIKGYIVLTWNLGSGPRRIFTPYPVPNLGRLFHTVRIGRHGQRAWLLVDDQRNVTGKSPGKLTQLNTRSIVYLGGHDSQNFSFLPHDLPLHTGFSGCLFDVELRTTQMLIKVDKSPPAFTRGVGHCGQNLCNERSCENGGGCINHGATFACLCAEGWFGPTCSTRYNPCDSTRHNCTEGSTCVPLKEGYSCDCPVGKTGVFCEKEEDLSDVKFKGIRSYIALSVTGLNHQQSCIDLEIRPATNHGLILYSGRPETNSFWSLTLQDGLVELRVSPGIRRKQGEVLIVKSRRMLALDKWHRIRAGRYGRRLFLWVEGTVNTGVLLPGENLPPGGTTVYLGGMPDLSKIPIGVSGNVLKPFEGCIRKFGSQWKTIPLTKSTILHGRNVEDCDGTVCGADVCNNGGTCHINANNIPICACLKQYKGERCEYRLSCQQMNCQNGGRCAEGKTRNPQCYCPNGWSGSFCEAPLSVKSPQFGGDSYLMIDKSENSNTKKRNVVSPKIDVDFIRLNFTTPEPNGFLLWTSSENHAEFVGIGVENERMKFVWNWEGHNATVVTSDHHVADGIWHQIAIGFDTPNVTIWLDERLVYSANDTYPGYPPSTDGKFYLGGFPAGSKVPDRTNGFFQTGFNGCLQEVDWGLEFPISNFSKFQGENIQTCDPF